MNRVFSTLSSLLTAPFRLLRPRRLMFKHDSGRGDVVFEFETGDPEMDAAIETARRTVDRFIESLEQPSPEKTYLVKLTIDDGGENEHIWMDHVTHADGCFYGTLANKPNSDTHEQGDYVSVKKEDISDWAIIHEDGMGEGGYTVQLIESRMQR